KLSEIVKPVKVTPAIIEFVDIAGLVKGASEGKGKGNAFLSHIREVDLIAHVVRCFDDDNVIHVEGGVDPIRDIGIIEAEHILNALESLKKSKYKLTAPAKSADTKYLEQAEIIANLRTFMEDGNPARAFVAEDQVRETWADLFLLTEKTVLYVCNVDEG